METVDLIAKLENNAIKRIETPHGVLQGYFVSEDDMVNIKRKLRETLTKEQRKTNARPIHR